MYKMEMSFFVCLEIYLIESSININFVISKDVKIYNNAWRYIWFWVYALINSINEKIEISNKTKIM
jgi:hypothetical protein